MNRPTNAGVNADAPTMQTHDGGAVRREAPTGIEPVNSGFAGQSHAPAMDRDGRNTQENGAAGTAMRRGEQAIPGDGMPVRMPGVSDAPARVVARIEDAAYHLWCGARDKEQARRLVNALLADVHALTGRAA